MAIGMIKPERNWAPKLDSYNASSGGLHSLSENYLYTVEALTQYIKRLREGGILSITRWIKTPPRDGLKMMATAIEALRQAGVADPGRQLTMIRSWNTTTLLVGNEAFSERDIDVLKAFYRERRFDPVFYHGMSRDEANSYNQLQEAWYFEGVVQLLGQDPARFLHEYKFDIRPATDDRPYFSQFLKWRTLPELLALRDRGGLPLLEWGYLILVATFALALLSSFLFLILPLWLRHRTASSGRIFSSE